MNPTPIQFDRFQALFDHFNRELFGGTLPAVILNFSRKRSVLGFFAPERWSDSRVLSGAIPEIGGNAETDRTAVIHEISLNPETLCTRPPRDYCSTLVHEMVHLWQAENGTPGKRGYHNAEWAAKMVEVGLMPSRTAAPGGKKTGPSCSHYIIDGGVYDVAFAKLDKGALPYSCSAESRVRTTARNKTKYTCPGCNANVWAKPDMQIACMECSETFEVSDG